MKPALVSLIVCLSLGAAPSDEIRYPALRAAIETTPAIDVHSHPQSAHRHYADNDIYPVLLPPISRPFWPTDPGRIAVWEKRQAAALTAIYGFPAGRGEVTRDDIPHLDELSRVFWAAGPREGLNRVLDRCGIAVTFSNRIAPPAGLDPVRVRWVPFVDPLFTPFDPAGLTDVTQELRDGLDAEFVGLPAIVGAAGIRPQNLEEHLRLIDAALAAFKRNGALALKVESAYHRSLLFEFVPRAEAEDLYDRGMRGELTSWRDYRRLQDFLARSIFVAAGTTGLPVHIHTGFGATATLKNLDSHPLNLEEVLSGMEFAGTKFVLLHAGYPYWRELKPLLEKKNVYVEISAANWMVFEEELAEILAEWCAYPGAARKIMFGADAGAPVFYHIAATNSRAALYRALARLIDRGIVNEAGAIEVARDILQRTASRVHDLGDGSNLMEN